jgi:hypothetical protein
MRTFTRSLFTIVSMVAVGGAPAAAFLPGAQAVETFGTAAEVAHVVNAFEFQAASAGVIDLDAQSGYHRYCSSVGGCELTAGVRLPAGAVMSRIELDACDDSSTQELRFSMWRTSAPGGPTSEPLTTIHTTGVAATPGCGKFTGALLAPTVVDNVSHNYWIFVLPNAGVAIAPTKAVRIAAVRVFYTLQVSPAPATATFGDVPTAHPFFRFVEALVASGITAGCGGGNYCPDAPLTRGQMAVFLGKGLGLHFAP